MARGYVTREHESAEHERKRQAARLKDRRRSFDEVVESAGRNRGKAKIAARLRPANFLEDWS